MCKIECDPVLWWCDYLPNTVLVDRIEVWEGRTGDGTVGLVNPSSTCVWGGKKWGGNLLGRRYEEMGVGEYQRRS